MMNKDLLVFIVMICCGAAVSLFFDLLRAVRMTFKPPSVLVAVSDVVFTAAAVFAVMACVWNFNSGIFRAYEPIGLLLGGIFYFLLASRWILKLFLLIIENILKFVGFIFKILLTPSMFLYKILVVPVAGQIKKLIQRSRDAYAKRIQK